MGELRVKLQPFRPPNFVIQEMGVVAKSYAIVEAPKYHLGEIPDETLIEMCEEFKATVLKKARDWRAENPGAGLK